MTLTRVGSRWLIDSVISTWKISTVSGKLSEERKVHLSILFPNNLDENRHVQRLAFWYLFIILNFVFGERFRLWLDGTNYYRCWSSEKHVQLQITVESPSRGSKKIVFGFSIKKILVPTSPESGNWRCFTTVPQEYVKPLVLRLMSLWLCRSCCSIGSWERGNRVVTRWWEISSEIALYTYSLTRCLW